MREALKNFRFLGEKEKKSKNRCSWHLFKKKNLKEPTVVINEPTINWQFLLAGYLKFQKIWYPRFTGTGCVDISRIGFMSP
jgi:hypothetical protein